MYEQGVVLAALFVGVCAVVVGAALLWKGKTLAATLPYRVPVFALPDATYPESGRYVRRLFDLGVVCIVGGLFPWTLFALFRAIAVAVAHIRELGSALYGSALFWAFMIPLMLCMLGAGMRSTTHENTASRTAGNAAIGLAVLFLYVIVGPLVVPLR